MEANRSDAGPEDRLYFRQLLSGRDFAATDPVKSPTAWNNRLASLAMLGLVAEISQGRSKHYKPIFEGV